MAIYQNKLAIADRSNNRVLIWNSLPTTTNQPADIVLGQANFTSNTANNGGRSNKSLANPEDVFFTASGQLIVTDYTNHRTLIWNSVPTNNFAPADLVIGQSDFTSATQGSSTTDYVKMSYPNTISIIDNSLLITGNNKVMIWDNFPTSNGQAANRIVVASGLQHLIKINGKVIGDYATYSYSYSSSRYSWDWPMTQTNVTPTTLN